MSHPRTVNPQCFIACLKEYFGGDFFCTGDRRGFYVIKVYRFEA